MGSTQGSYGWMPAQDIHEWSFFKLRARANTSVGKCCINAVKRAVCYFKGSNRIMKLDSDKKIVRLIKSLIVADKFSIEIPQNGNKFIQADFELDGIQDVVFNIKARCPRKKKYWN
jgi:hypothetical protein